MTSTADEPPDRATDARARQVDLWSGEILDEMAGEGSGRTDSTAERLAKIEAVQGHLHDAVTAILDRLDGRSSASGESKPSRWSWRHLDHDGRERLLSEVQSFVDWLVDRYEPDGRAKVPPCWHRHPVAVEEFIALMAAWQFAYCGGDAVTDALADWHGRYLWPTLDRLHEHARWQQCTNRFHQAADA